MFFFGHLGFTLGIIYVITCNIKKDWKIDYRFLLLGAILPDIFDKLIGRVFFGDYFNNGRIFFHTLLFITIIIIISLVLSNPKLICLSSGWFLHILEDRMWMPCWHKTLFWPFLGFNFPESDTENYFSFLISHFFNEPYIYLTEIIGIVIILSFFFKFRLYNKMNTHYFITTGNLHK